MPTPDLAGSGADIVDDPNAFDRLSSSPWMAYMPANPPGICKFVCECFTVARAIGKGVAIHNQQIAGLCRARKRVLKRLMKRGGTRSGPSQYESHPDRRRLQHHYVSGPRPENRYRCRARRHLFRRSRQVRCMKGARTRADMGPILYPFKFSHLSDC